MQDQNNGVSPSLLFLLLKNPYVLIGAGILAVVFLMFFLIVAGDDNSDSGIEEGEMEELYGVCEPRDIEDDREFAQTFQEQFEGKGVLEDTSEFFIAVANNYNIDPVLLASISFHETGNGTSNLVKNKNNPGGLYNSSAGEFFEFDSLQEGIDAMAKNLYDNYISEGLVSIRQIGEKYAPIGVENDPNNLNINWIPTIENYVQDFGGLTMNCQTVDFGTGEFAYPIPDAIVTSNFGYRIDPITGATGDMHRGVDFNCDEGDPIYSAQEGHVVVAVSGCRVGDSNCGGGWGNYVILDHGESYTLYGHLTSLSVGVGDEVGRSQPVGACGTTGGSTGTHLHFEVQLSLYGERVDPMLYLEGEES